MLSGRTNIRREQRMSEHLSEIHRLLKMLLDSEIMK